MKTTDAAQDILRVLAKISDLNLRAEFRRHANIVFGRETVANILKAKEKKVRPNVPMLRAGTSVVSEMPAKLFGLSITFPIKGVVRSVDRRKKIVVVVYSVPKTPRSCYKCEGEQLSVSVALGQIECIAQKCGRPQGFQTRIMKVALSDFTKKQ